MIRERHIVLLGMMSKIPVAGVVWQTVHYLLGFQRLGLVPYYVEAHARTPSMLMREPDDDSGRAAAEFIDGVMRRFGLGGHWAYQALHADGRCYGMRHGELMALYDAAELIINLHGGTAPRDEHSRTGRLVYLETDPVQLQVELADGAAETIEFLEQHCAFFTFGENWSAPDCGLPVTRRFRFHATRQPVVRELWPANDQPGERYTTVGNFRQAWRDVRTGGRTLTWSKHVEFERVLDLPGRTRACFELALGSYDDNDAARLTGHGWSIRPAAPLSKDIGAYREYISSSRGEFTAAKEQNVLLRSGWFSDRSATYLAAGRPVITQDTGFSNVLPTGVGLHAYTTVEEAAGMVARIDTDYGRERHAAAEIAREYFDSDVVLGTLLDTVGVSVPDTARRQALLRDGLPLTPVSRRPLVLPPATMATTASAPLPVPEMKTSPVVAPMQASVILVSHDDVNLTRLSVESVLQNTTGVSFELIIVDNGSTDGSRAYLRTIARRFPWVRLVLNDRNRGFAAATNQGVKLAQGGCLVLLNSDTVVSPGWLAPLIATCEDPTVGLVGPVTNRIGSEAEVVTGYGTYGRFLDEAASRARTYAGRSFEIATAVMFCVALRRDVYERIGPLDERFGPGTLEDDDYAKRVAQAGLRSLCREDVLVHHFGEGSIGRLYRDGSYGRLLTRNQRLFEQKWGQAWEPYDRHQDHGYVSVRKRVQAVVEDRIAVGAAVLVVSRGDDELVRFPHHQGWHYPQSSDGVYAGHYPATAGEAVAQLEALRRRGAQYLVFPEPSRWWLSHYAGLYEHLRAHYASIVDEPACIVFALEGSR